MSRLRSGPTAGLENLEERYGEGAELAAQAEKLSPSMVQWLACFIAAAALVEANDGAAAALTFIEDVDARRCAEDEPEQPT